MKTEILTPAVAYAHRRAGEELAKAFKRNPVGTLEGMAFNFRAELAAYVYQFAEVKGLKRIKVRHHEVTSYAKFYLENPSALST